MERGSSRASAICHTNAAVLNAGFDRETQTVGGRILVTIANFIAVIIIASYTANLAAFLTRVPPSSLALSSFSALSDPSLRLCVRQGTALTATVQPLPIETQVAS